MAIKLRFKHLSKRQIIWAGICLTCLLLIGILQLYRNVIVSGLLDQNEAGRWSKNGNSAQVSVFFAPDANITQDKVREFEYDISKALTDNSITDPSPQADARLWADCYSAYGSVVLTNDSKNITTQVMGVGGDFFLFHPVELVAGAYFSGDDLMKDRIIIDEDMAFQLFGSDNVIGKSVTIGGVPHYIVGVVKRERGKFADAAGLSQSLAYLSYDSLRQYGSFSNSVQLQTDQAGSGTGITTDASAGNTSGTTGNGIAAAAAGMAVTAGKSTSAAGTSSPSAAGAGLTDSTMQTDQITCYEVVLPDPVKGFAASLLQQKLPLSLNQVKIVDNTARFGIPTLVKTMTGFGIRSMQENGLCYPYWENIARGWEDVLALVILVQGICIVILLLIIVIAIVQTYRHKKWTAAGIWKMIMDKKYDMESKIKYHNEKWKYF
ncbi:MAG: ABC transporter permease [Butyrivibrio sp.]|nr:ABC transporter permease [Butyrivibrio sp.]